MTVQMNIAEAKAKLAELVRRAEAGEEVVIARDGKPAAVIRPIRDRDFPKERILGRWAHLGPLRDPYLFLRPDPELEAAMKEPVAPPRK